MLMEGEAPTAGPPGAAAFPEGKYLKFFVSEADEWCLAVSTERSAVVGGLDVLYHAEPAKPPCALPRLIQRSAAE